MLTYLVGLALIPELIMRWTARTTDGLSGVRKALKTSPQKTSPPERRGGSWISRQVSSFSLMTDRLQTSRTEPIVDNLGDLLVVVIQHHHVFVTGNGTG